MIFADNKSLLENLYLLSGPIIAILGFIIFIQIKLSKKSIKIAEKQLEDQRISFHKERLESNFYELLKFHRDNVNNMKIGQVNGSEVFKIIFDKFIKIYEIVNSIFMKINNENDIYEINYIEELKLNNTLKKREIDLIEYAKVDISYLILFFGETIDGFKAIEHFLSNRYKPEIFNKIKYFIADTNISIEPQKGYEFQLGHYYRHLFHIVFYIHKDSKLNKDEKYQYIRVLRGQLSTYEQYALFLNSLSFLARIWELEDKKNPSIEIEQKDQLITKYDLIRNLPANKIVGNLKCSDFYPNVNYEVFRVE